MYKIKENLFYRNIENELIIYNKEQKETYVLNEIGKDIFNLLEGHTFEYVIKELLKKYDSDKKIIIEDTENLIKNLKKIGFILEE